MSGSRGAVAGILLVVLAALGALFVVQNSSRTTQLSLDLGIAAWQLEQPVTIPALIGISFGVGVVTGLLSVTPRMFRLSARVRQLEQQAAIQSFDRGGSAGSRDVGSW